MAKTIPTESEQEFEWVPIEQLEPAEYNPRSWRPGPLAKLKRSIQQFGQLDPIVANRFNNRIIGGHMRYKAYSDLGYEKVAVRWANIEDEDEEKAANVALNNAELAGEWDNAKLAELLGSIEDKTTQLLTGFDKTQIDSMIAKASQEKIAPTYPLAAKMLEHYDYAVIFVTNESDWLNLLTMLGLETERSYKKEKIGTGRVITFDRFMELWEARGPAPKPRPKEAE